MEVWPFRQPVGRAISPQCPNKGQGTKNIEIQCPIITKTENQIQRNFPMRLVIQLQANLAMATDTASPALLHVSPATVQTNDVHDRHPHGSCLLHTKVGKATSSNLKHNDGHIHRASPIRGLPPENSKPANIGYDRQEDLHKLMTGPIQMQKGSIENPTGTSTST